MRLPNQGPRAVRLREGFLTNLLMLEIALAALLIAAPILIDRIGANERELAKSGFAVTGRALGSKLGTRPTPPKAGEKGDAYGLSYEYVFNGMRYSGRSPVDLETYYTTPKGKELKIRVSPNDPKTSMIEGSERRFERERQNAWYFYFGTLALFGGASLIWRALARRERRMLRDWAAFPAKVTKIHEIDRGESKTYEAEVLVTDRDVSQEMRIALKRGPTQEGEQTYLLQNPERPDEIQLVNDLKYVEPPQSSSPYP